ncbi:hypothetical protein ACVW1C_005869 [Bradyrhizobium sp. USDA 4011]
MDVLKAWLARLCLSLYQPNAGMPENRFSLLASVPTGPSGTVVAAALHTAVPRWIDCFRGTCIKQLEDLRLLLDPNLSRVAKECWPVFRRWPLFLCRRSVPLCLTARSIS